MKTTINLDLEDNKSLDIAEVIGNKSCRRILIAIAEKEMTETDISKKLAIPLNTVDYNVKKLVKAGLIESTSHFWSVKGKRIPSYKVSNKKIVISPKSFSSKILLIPSLLMGGVLALLVKKITESAYPTSEMTLKTADSYSSSLSSTAPVASSTFFQIISGWQWFLIGIWSGVVLFFILNYINERRKNE